MRRIGFALLLFLIAAALSAPAALACGNCSPTIKSGWTTTSYSVFLSSSLSAPERQAAINGINMWNQWFTSNGESAPFTLVTVGPAALNIQENNTLGTDPAGIDSTYHFIFLNPLYNSRADGFLTDIMGHELGHSLGFNDQNDAFCYPYTIMHGGISATSGSYLSGLGSADPCALSLNFPPPPPPPPPSPTGLIGAEGWWCPLCADPLVLDLDGSGIQTSDTSSPVWFDLNADGVPDHITWTKAHTNAGFLWIDLHHDGKVDDGSELFGVGTVMPDGTKAENGFAALAMYDDPKFGGNGDGVISSADAVWNHLRIWVDWNHNGVCDRGETGPIEQYGIDEIPLGAVIAHMMDVSGNMHALQGTYIRHVTQDGKRVEAQFAIDSLDFRPVP